MATPSNRSDRIFRFGQFELSEREGELRKNGMRIKLQDQPFRVLVELVSNAGQMVTRDELQQKLWPADTFVDFDTGLNTAVRKIRQALIDDADNPRFIETTPRRGYRFVAAVTQTPVPDMPGERQAVPVQVEPTATAVGKKSHKTKLLVMLGAAVAIVSVVAIAYSIYRMPGRWRSTARLMEERRLTSNPPEAPVNGAALSPDGSYLAYSDPTGMYVRAVASGEVRALQLPADCKGTPDAWAADSVHLLITCLEPSNDIPSIWEISILGGSQRKLVEDGASGRLSPDGKRLAFLRGYLAVGYFLGRLPSAQLWIANLEDGSEAKIAEAGTSADPNRCVSTLGSPTWSADGGRIAYLEHDCGTFGAGGSSLKTRNASGADMQLLFASGSFECVFTWQPSGKMIFVERAGAKGHTLEALTVDPSSGKARGAKAVIGTVNGKVSGISATADGKRFAIWRDDRQQQVFVANMDPKTHEIDTPRRLTLDENANLPHTWTPDSAAVVFDSNRNGKFQIFKQGLLETAPELLVSDGNSILPRLSADGNSILYLFHDEKAESKVPSSLMKVSLNDGSRQRLVTMKDIFNLQCARNPARLCLISAMEWQQKKIHFYALDTDSGGAKELFTMEGPHAWTLSPDGQTLAVLMVPGDMVRLHSMIDGSEREIHVKGWNHLHSIDWTADGQMLLIPGYGANGLGVLLGVNLDGTARVLRESERNADFFHIIPSPDGKHAALDVSLGESNVWLQETP